MENNIYFREIEKADYRALEKIISDTWNYERFCLPKTAQYMAKLYLASCLANQTFTCVAVNNGEPVGIIMGKDENHHRIPLRYSLLQISATILILLSRDGRRVAKLFGGFEKIDKVMLDKSGMTFDGQLAFFVVRNDQRGTGVGKKLFTSFLKYLKFNGIQNYYLYTDSKCNYGFYEHQGLVRIGETSVSLKPKYNEELQMYLYAYHC